MVSRETSRELPAWMQPAQAGLTTYVDILAGPGVERGLMGPREVPKLWDRHILNCAVVADPALGFIPMNSLVADVGSGAGLPGLVWALVRPDLTMVLVEPLLRRATFLTEAVVALGLTDRVTVVRGRAEKVMTNPEWSGVDVVTARAVAPLDRLLGWTIPLLKPNGRLVALKGSSAPTELDSAQEAVKEFNVTSIEVLTCGAGVVEPETTVVLARRGSQ
jgi:16S rRNA (guanine527-N7)-methyltransferase